MEDPTRKERIQAAFDRHTAEGFRCTDPECMFPAQTWTWCTRGDR